MAGGDPWAIILAAGDGTRLSGVARAADGAVVPKQYCAFGTGRTLLARTVERARRIVPRERIVGIVAERHRRWWASEGAEILPQNVVVQPQNRGTAPGLLLPLLEVFVRDPSAIAVVLPSDHHVERSPIFDAALRDAIRLAQDDALRVFLLGIVPEGAESGYGWIVPSPHGAAQALGVGAFIEKPGPRHALALLQGGACWSSFIMVGRAGAFLDLYRRALPELLRVLLPVARPGRGGGPREPSQALRDVYASIQLADFSRDVLQGECVRESLGLVRVPACGWTDLGTPERLSRWLATPAGA